ncbi:MAG: 1,2-phenylacetyl-CoA epoxidase subunit B [Candidatus Eisenbacteria bacterium]|nr:1,2-phenylacetyl-CoA epoxidase subunit B [Candidatus Eisenbacteria bacterium]
MSIEEAKPTHDQGDLWEVFLQEDGQPHVHAGSLRAPDAEMALQNARDVYARRGAVTGLWVVRTADIAATEPADRAALFDGPRTKAYRHAHFYPLPGGMKEP